MTQRQVPPPDELILEMLRRVLARQAELLGRSSHRGRPEPTGPAGEAAQPTVPSEHLSQAAAGEAPTDADDVAQVAQRSDTGEPLENQDPLLPGEARDLAEYNAMAGQAVTPARLLRTLGLLATGLLGVLVLINLPIFNGIPVARALPDRQAFIIRDGLVLKGSGPEVYVLESNQRRWISSLDAFEHYGYTWNDVHTVDDAVLERFPSGRPLHVLLKCPESVHIYRLENNQKRWIKDIPTLMAEGHVWNDVRLVDCARLRLIPDGPPIPPDAGPPPGDGPGERRLQRAEPAMVASA